MIGVELYTVGARLEMSLENGYFYDTSMKMKSLGLLFEIFLSVVLLFCASIFATTG